MSYIAPPVAVLFFARKPASINSFISPVSTLFSVTFTLISFFIADCLHHIRTVSTIEALYLERICETIGTDK
jgi:hypothetical protein